MHSRADALTGFTEGRTKRLELGTILDKRSDASASMLGATPSLSDASAKSDAARQPPSSRHPKCSGTNSSTDTELTVSISELSDSCRVLPERYSFFQNLLVQIAWLLVETILMEV